MLRRDDAGVNLWAVPLVWRIADVLPIAAGSVLDDATRGRVSSQGRRERRRRSRRRS